MLPSDSWQFPFLHLIPSALSTEQKEERDIRGNINSSTLIRSERTNVVEAMDSQHVFTPRFLPRDILRRSQNNTVVVNLRPSVARRARRADRLNRITASTAVVGTCTEIDASWLALGKSAVFGLSKTSQNLVAGDGLKACWKRSSDWRGRGCEEHACEGDCDRSGLHFGDEDRIGLG